MKQINFVQNIPPHKQQEARIWLLLTLGPLAALVVYLIIINASSLPALYHIWHIRNNLKQTSQTHAQAPPEALAQITKTHQKLTKRISKLQRYREGLNPLITFIQTAQRAQAAGINIQSLRVNRRSFECAYQCKSTDQVHRFLKHVRGLPIVAHAEIAQLDRPTEQKATQGLSAMIKGTLARNQSDDAHKKV